MDIEQKLKRCVEFIRRIEKMNTIGTVSVNAENVEVVGDFCCDDCGSRDIIGETRITVKNPLKDDAWHLLIDIDEL